MKTLLALLAIMAMCSPATAQDFICVSDTADMQFLLPPSIPKIGTVNAVAVFCGPSVIGPHSLVQP